MVHRVPTKDGALILFLLGFLLGTVLLARHVNRGEALKLVFFNDSHLLLDVAILLHFLSPLLHVLNVRNLVVHAVLYFG